MSSFTINPNKSRDFAREEAASLERDQAAIHHYDNDGRDPSPAPYPGQPPAPPLLAQVAPPPRPAPPPVAEVAPAPPRYGAAHGQALHPLLAGLVAMLPPAGADWGCEERLHWIRAVENAFHLVYGAHGAIRIEAEEAPRR